MSRARRSLVATATALACGLASGLFGCGRQQPSPSAVVATELHTEADLAVVIHQDGSLDVRRSLTGVRRMRVPRFEVEPRGFGHEYEVPICPTRVSRDGHLVVVSSHAIRIFSLADGRLVNRFPYSAGGPPRACPDVTPDSALVVHLGRYNASGRVVKLAWDGREHWHVDLPDIGPLLGAVQVDQERGVVVLTSATHLLALAADGTQAYAYGHAQPGGR